MDAALICNRFRTLKVFLINVMALMIYSIPVLRLVSQVHALLNTTQRRTSCSAVQRDVPKGHTFPYHNSDAGACYVKKCAC